MKSIPILLAAALTTGTLLAAPMQKAEVTRTVNQVRIVPGEGDSREARPGDTIEGRTAVRTGDRARAELRFTDQTLTRLGANSQFSFETGTRNLQLDNGVMFLQVPKDAGGAQVRTAAVTAAVTGTTIMVEFVAGKMIKVIVVEGTLDLFFPDHPGDFITLKAGQMIMMDPASRIFPHPVDVDLEKLLKTSKLADDKEFGPLNDDAQHHVHDAVANQNQQIQDGQLTRTNLVLPGRGTRLLLLDRDTLIGFRPGGGFDQLGGQPPHLPLDERPGPKGNLPGDPRLLPPPLVPGEWVINENTLLRTSVPLIRDPEQAGRGAIYVPGATGPLHPWLFGTIETVPGTGLADALGGTGPWSIYLLQNVMLGGTPEMNLDGPQNIGIASPHTITKAGEQTTVLDLGSLHNFGIFTQGGGIDFRGGLFAVNGTQTNVLLHANGPTANLDFAGAFDLGEGNLHTLTGGDSNFRPSSSIWANSWYSNSASAITVDSTTAHIARTLDLRGDDYVVVRNSNLQVGNNTVLSVSDSNQLAALTVATGTGGSVRIQSNNSDVVFQGYTMVGAHGSGGNVEILAPNGRVELNGGASEGMVSLSASDRVLVAAGGNVQPAISLFGVEINAPVVNILANGPNAEIRLQDTSIAATSAAKIYAEGTNSMVQMASGVTLSGPEVRIAGQTVRVLPGVTVNATNVGTLGIHADNHQYNLNSTALPNQSFGLINTGPSTRVYASPYSGRSVPIPAPNAN